MPLARAALQFPLGHQQVATMIPGARSPAEVQQNAQTFAARRFRPTCGRS